MNRLLLLISVLALIFVATGPGIWAQETDEFVLEDVIVTAEKREINMQEVPASVTAVVGADLLEQGKITTEQFIENIPNVTYQGGPETNPDGNIVIRGVQRTQESAGVNSVLPSTTATYTDGVYQGIGGNYDVNRIEVLRGPQGTLYGRSATGGVVAFHTNNPKLSEFEASGFVEFGTASLLNVQAMVNVPLGEKLALRAAGHLFERDGYFNATGGQTETNEGRLKLLWQPVDEFEMILSGSLQETTNWGGGYSPKLVGPDKIDYTSYYTEPQEGAPHKYRQIAINAKYDLGNSTITYVGGYHDYDNTGMGAPAAGKGGSWHADMRTWPTDWYHSQEIRWASDNDGQLTWLVGANYFKHEYDTRMYSVQTDWDPADTELDRDRDYAAPIFGQDAVGTFENWGIFTEETFKLSDEFRVTAGLRYDTTELVQSVYWRMNENLSAMFNNMNPPIWWTAPPLEDDTHDYDNTTYKLRFEYDLTPDNMIYALTATGFMPGYVGISPQIGMGPGGIDITFNLMQMDQQELTSYEVGTKNQFLDDTLRLNGAFFFYDYEGYPEAIPIAMMGPSPIFAVFAVPLKMTGLELEAAYLPTMNDKLWLTAGYQKIEIDEFPTVEKDGVEYPGQNFMALEDLPGHPELTANLGYEHTFLFSDGSVLVPKAELRYIRGYYLTQMSQAAVDGGLMPYNYQDDYLLCNVGVTWTSASEMWSITGYGRNLFDEEYKARIDISSDTPFDAEGVPQVGVTPGDPRTFGLMVNVRY